MRVILSGPSGVGKNAVVELWQRDDPRVIRVVTHTTRPPRPGEVDGKHYYFVDDVRFEALAQSGQFLDHRRIFGARYGMARCEVARASEGGRVAVLEVDVTGGLHILREIPDAMSIFLLPPSVAELRRRLKDRGSDSDKVISARLARAHEEIALAASYRIRLVNVHIEDTVAKIKRIVDDAASPG